MGKSVLGRKSVSLQSRSRCGVGGTGFSTCSASGFSTCSASGFGLGPFGSGFGRDAVFAAVFGFDLAVARAAGFAAVFAFAVVLGFALLVAASEGFFVTAVAFFAVAAFLFVVALLVAARPACFFLAVTLCPDVLAEALFFALALAFAAVLGFPRVTA